MRKRSALQTSCNRFEQIGRSDGVPFKLLQIAGNRQFAVVICHIEHSETQLTLHLVSCLKVLCFFYFSNQIFRKLFSGLVMSGKLIEPFFFVCPVFVNLRGQFHKIPINIGSRSSGELALRQHTVQTMSKLVQKSGHFVKSQQGRRAIGRFRKIGHKRNVRPD